MKKFLLLLRIIGIVIGVLIAAFYMFVISGMFAIFMPAPPEPKITYGEFPFTITYEVNNEIFVYEDIVICEYEGVVSWGTAGKVRTWSRRLKSENETIVLLQSEENGIPFVIYESIPGLPEYYMGDFRYGQTKEMYERAMKDYSTLGYMQGDIDRSITKEEAWEKYHVRVISIESAPPIKNSFEE